METKVNSAKTKIWVSFYIPRRLRHSKTNEQTQRQMNKQSGFNAEQIEKDNYPENKTIWRLNLKWQVNTAKQKPSDWQNQQVIKREDNISLKVLHSPHRLTLGC